MKLENKTVEELKNMCRNKKISGYSKLNKQGLINLLNNNKKGGYVVKNWMKAFSNNFAIINGRTRITKNNIAGDINNAFVPLKNYELQFSKSLFSGNKVFNNKKEVNFNKLNKETYPIINKMIYDYLMFKQNLHHRINNSYKQEEKKIEKIKEIIQKYLPVGANYENYRNYTKTKINYECNWWYLDNSLEFKQIKGTYITSGFYQPMMKEKLPSPLNACDGFIIIKTSQSS